MGTIAAIVLGVVSIPLREVTTASNLTFPFLALTIAIAELGGPWSAVATALGSALSLDFFLTKPYLRLTIEGKHDVIAFFGLAACGLVAAAFSARRRRMLAERRVDRAQLDLLRGTLTRLEASGPVELVLTQILETARGTLPLSALAVRDERERLVASSPREPEPARPTRILRADTLLQADSASHVVPTGGLPFPKDGGRLPLVVRGRRVGSLDLWGGESLADAGTRQTLSAVGRIAGEMLLHRRDPQQEG